VPPGTNTLFQTLSTGSNTSCANIRKSTSNLDALKPHADRIVPMVGRESRGYPTYEVNVELSKELGRELIELPGGHIDFNSEPAEFAREFLQALARTGHGPKL
jgi:hypothetical protein